MFLPSLMIERVKNVESGINVEGGIIAKNVEAGINVEGGKFLKKE